MFGRTSQIVLQKRRGGGITFREKAKDLGVSTTFELLLDGSEFSLVIVGSRWAGVMVMSLARLVASSVNTVQTCLATIVNDTSSTLGSLSSTLVSLDGAVVRLTFVVLGMTL